MPEYNPDNFDIIPQDSQESNLPAPGTLTEHPFDRPKDLMGPQPGDEHLQVRFYNRPKPDAGETQKKGRPIYKNKAYVKINIPGDRTSEIDQPAYDTHKARFVKQWEAFQKNQEMPLHGTPIDEWPAVTEARRMELKAVNVFTIEDCAAVSDALLKNIGHDGRALRGKAIAWLEQANKGASSQDMATELAKRDEDIEVLKAQVKMMQQNMVPRDAVPATETAEPKRKPGRPKKA